jgi:hypothetical protein
LKEKERENMYYQTRVVARTKKENPPFAFFGSKEDERF